MKNFMCECEYNNVLFFESTLCNACGRLVGYCPDQQQMRAFDVGATAGEWISIGAQSQSYRQCSNYSEHQVCNWMVPAEEDQTLCRACRLNEVIPDLSEAQNLQYWGKMEAAKRRMLYTILELGLPLANKREDPQRGLLFRFMADKDVRSEFTEPLPGQIPIYTGHEQGEITINLAEADDVARTRARVQMGEAYRTLLGHFRHEIGHYYWGLLVEPQPELLEQFRQLFGDEQPDYAAAQARHYQEGPPSTWADSFISAYASMHPWEDWAECWAHTMHMIDTLETAQALQLQLDGKPIPSTDLPGSDGADITAINNSKANRLIADWMRLALGMNALDRSMGLDDAYPFVLTEPIREKLRWIYRLILKEAARQAQA